MFTIAILINGKLIAKGTAQRTSMRPDGTAFYRDHNGGTLTHNYHDGPKPLALQLLDRMDMRSLEEKLTEAITHQHQVSTTKGGQSES